MCGVWENHFGKKWIFFFGKEHRKLANGINFAPKIFLILDDVEVIQSESQEESLMTTKYGYLLL